MTATKKKAPPSKSGTKSKTTERSPKAKKRAPCRTTTGKTQGEKQTRERRQTRQQQTRQGGKQQRQEQTSKRAAPTSLEKELRGVDDVYLTPKSIAVRRVKTDKNGRIVSDKTQYFDRSKSNMKTLRREMGNVRVGRN